MHLDIVARRFKIHRLLSSLMFVAFTVWCIHGLYGLVLIECIHCLVYIEPIVFVQYIVWCI